MLARNLVIYKLEIKKKRKNIPLPHFYNYGFLFFKITSSEGIYGLGEPNPYLGNLGFIEKKLKKIFDKHLKNKKIENINFYKLKNLIKDKVSKSLVSSFQHAYFDIIGKSRNLSVGNLISRKKNNSKKIIDLYASGGTIFEDKSYDILLDEALFYKTEGYSGWKFRPKMPISNQSHSSRMKYPPNFNIREVIDFSKKLRNNVGSNFNLMIDVGCRCKNIKDAKYLFDGLSELNFFFIEEPFKRNILIYKNLKKELKKKINISFGEHLFDFVEFNHWLKADCFDIIQPDTNLLLYEELFKINNKIKRKNKNLILHNWCNPVNVSSNFSFLSSLKEESMCEYNVQVNDFYKKFDITGYKIKKGKAEILNVPGLGVDFLKELNKDFIIYEKTI